MPLIDPLLSLAVVLIAGIAGGELLGRFGLPKVTGWIGTGILLSSLQIPGLETERLVGFSPLVNFVLGFIAFTVGATLYFANLRNAGARLALLCLGEALFTPALVYVALLAVGVDSGAALILGAVAIAGAPGTTVLVVQEARARGTLTRTLVAAVGLIDMVAVGVFVVVGVFVASAATELDTFGSAAIAAGHQFAVSFVAGVGIAAVVLGLTRTIIGPAFLGPAMVAVILGAFGLGRALDVSGILTCTFAGIAVSNMRHETANAAEAYLRPMGGVLFAAFYTLAGMRLNFAHVIPLALPVAVFFLGRLAGKAAGAYVAMRISGGTSGVRRYLGVALLPHGGVAVGLILLVQSDPRFAAIQDIVVSVGLAALAVNQLLGPSATRLALQRAGEAGQDRPRLLDFLTEARIVTGLVGNDKRKIVEQLSERLYATNKVAIPRQEFVERVLEREAEASTCLGEGFMIPHAVLAEGEQITGVLGLSSKGLELGASDGAPVQAVVLLATPKLDQRKHLEILAAFASAITHDANLREQLYHARSPAHAYEVLHAKGAEELNYFLDDAIQQATADASSPSQKLPR